MSIDFRKCLYALSDVIINRPPPLRIYDQIYMKLPDMLLQAEIIGRWFDKKKVLFIGDGDAIGLAVAHLGSQGLISGLPNHIHVLDFDERIVLSIKNFANDYGLNSIISARLYNVVDPLPEDIWQNYDAFYTNPPWGSSNEGSSVWAFVGRGIEGVRSEASACIVIGDHPSFRWTHYVLASTQEKAFKEGFHVAEMLPEFHRYHLDDNPELTSCCLILRRNGKHESKYNSQRLGKNDLKNFYGREAPLMARYIRDLTNGGKFPSRDFSVEPLEKE